MNFFHTYYWQLPILIVVICLVYSASRFEDWGNILRETWRWAIRMAGFLVAIGAMLYALALWLRP